MLTGIRSYPVDKIKQRQTETLRLIFIYLVKIHMKHTINYIPNVYFDIQKVSQTVHMTQLFLLVTDSNNHSSKL